MNLQDTAQRTSNNVLFGRDWRLPCYPKFDLHSYRPISSFHSKMDIQVQYWGYNDDLDSLRRCSVLGKVHTMWRRESTAFSTASRSVQFYLQFDQDLYDRLELGAALIKEDVESGLFQPSPMTKPVSSNCTAFSHLMTSWPFMPLTVTLLTASRKRMLKFIQHLSRLCPGPLCCRKPCHEYRNR